MQNSKNQKHHLLGNWFYKKLMFFKMQNLSALCQFIYSPFENVFFQNSKIAHSFSKNFVFGVQINFFFQTIQQSISGVSQSILVFILTLKIDSWMLLWLKIGLTIEKTQLLFVNLVFNLYSFFLFWHDSLSMAKNRDWNNTSNH